MKKVNPISLEENRFCTKNILNSTDSVINNIIVYSDYAVIYQELSHSVPPKSVENIVNANIKGRQYNGYMSDATKRKVTRILETWLSSLNYYHKTHPYIPKRMQRHPVFLTLTLSSPQVHDDNHVKRRILMPFIAKLKQLSDFRYYFWRAEKQANGNIHFHLILDCYVDKREVQNIWNYCQEKLGYISRFKQLYHHENPPSTHIKKIPSGSNIVSYLLKYATKDDSHGKVEGRIWGCSDELRDLKPFVEQVDGKLSDELEKMRNDERYEFVYKEHVTIIYFKSKKGKDALPNRIKDSMQQYYIDTYFQLYSKRPDNDLTKLMHEFSEDLTAEDLDIYWHQTKIKF